MKITALFLATASLLCTCGDTRGDVSEAVDLAMPSVVAITVELNGDAFRFAYRPESKGSGVVVDAARGLVITNAHVVAGIGVLQTVTVVLHDGHYLPAVVVGTDERADVAVLRVPTDIVPLTEIARGDVSTLRVGDLVIAIGNPFGLGHVVTVGIVSALHQIGDLNEFEDFIQIDASINPGNSGGALLNERGELVGINSAGISSPGGGIGFAIPADLALFVAGQLEDGRRSWGLRIDRIGVQVEDVTSGVDRARLGVAYRFGVLVTAVTAGGPAELAGLRQGDVLLSVGGTPAASKAQVGHRIRTMLGRAIELRILRHGAELVLSVAGGRS